MTKVEYLIVKLLIAEPAYPAELIKRSAGGVRRSTAYTTLKRMVKKGLVSTSAYRFKHGKQYHPTELGLKLAGNHEMKLQIMEESKAKDELVGDGSSVS